jgi:soluble lytic murein transglycosylase-like protein
MLVSAGNTETPKNIQLVEAQEMLLVQGNSLMPSWTALVSPQNALGAMIDTKEYLLMFLRETSDKYGVEYDELYRVIQCESSWRTNIYGDNGLAFGIAQFHRPTFDRFCKGNY